MVLFIERLNEERARLDNGGTRQGDAAAQRSCGTRIDDGETKLYDSGT